MDNFIQKLNTYLITNHLDEITEGGFIDFNKYNFPTNIYIERDIEDDLYKALEDSNKVLISGWAGSGKTSLLHYTLNKYKTYLQNFYIYYHPLKNSSFIYKMNQSEIEKRFINILKNRFLFLEEEYNKFLLYYALEVDFTFNDYNIELTPSDPIDSKFTILLQGISTGLLQGIKDNFDKNTNESLFITIKYITCYMRETLWIIIDDLDIAHIEDQKKILQKIKNCFFDITHENFKIIALLRNDKIYDAIHAANDNALNLFRFNLSATPTSEYNSNNDKFQSEPTTIFKVYVQKLESYVKINPNTSHDIENLKKISNLLQNRDNGLNQLYINIFQLSNHSIRFALEFINKFSYWILTNKLLPTDAKPSYIHSLLYAWVSKDNYQLCVQGLNPIPVIENVERNHSSLGCDIEYLLLTYINSKREVNFNELLNDFKRYFENISESMIKDSLYRFYTNGDTTSLNGRFGHIIFLYNNNNIITDKQEIKNRTNISIMPRGRAILKSSFKFTFSNFIYHKYYIAADNTAKKYFKSYKDNMDKHIDNQYFLLARLYSVHLIELQRIKKRMRTDDWSESYRTLFGFNNMMQLENIIEDNKKFLKLTQCDENIINRFENIKKEYKTAYTSFSAVPNLTIRYIQSKYRKCINSKDYEDLYNFLDKNIILTYYFSNSNDAESFMNNLKILSKSKTSETKDLKAKIDSYLESSQFLIFKRKKNAKL